ncbi:MAG: redoxin domain-containing protein [Deltaproteobacteria bacterium]|nr:redoxin domain-containing protein [Deltaproteobacteria bacterium]
MPPPGEPAPELRFPLVGGARFDLDEARAEQDYLIVEVYRGHHCGVCETHLRELAAMKDDFAEYGAALVFVSMNDQALAERAEREWALSAIPIGYDLDLDTARRWGIFISSRFRESEPRTFTEPATFVVRRDGILYAADLRSSPHLRPQLDRLLTLVRRASEGYPPRGIA